MTTVTTDAQFELFRDTALKHIAELGLTDWNIKITSGDLQAHSLKSIVSVDMDARFAEIRQNDVIDGWWTEYGIKTTAYHDVLEILLSDLSEMIPPTDARYCTVEKVTYSIIHRLVHLAYGQEKNLDDYGYAEVSKKTSGH